MQLAPINHATDSRVAPPSVTARARWIRPHPVAHR